MSLSKPKKRKLEEEKREFQENWENDFFHVNDGGKPTCIICHKQCSAVKTYNVKRHYETMHKAEFEGVTGVVRTTVFAQLKAAWQTVREREVHERKVSKAFPLPPHSITFLKNCSFKQAKEAQVRASYEIAMALAEELKPHSEGPFIKKCLDTVAKNICPEYAPDFEKIPLSRPTISSRMDKISDNLEDQLKEKIQTFDCYSLALDESCDITGTSQLAVFIRGVTSDGEVSQYFLTLFPMMGQTRGEDVFEALMIIGREFGLDWKK